MTPLLPIGLSIVLNAVLLTGGLLWSKRQVKHAVTERASDYRDMFRLAPRRGYWAFEPADMPGWPFVTVPAAPAVGEVGWLRELDMPWWPDVLAPDL